MRRSCWKSTIADLGNWGKPPVIITDVRAVQPVAPDAPADWRTSMGQFLVAIDTDDGLTGYGVGGGGLAAVHIVRAVLRARLVGRDSSAIRELAEEMHAATLPFGRMGVAIMAISGIDLALWDLRGKRENKPVVELLGGRPGVPLPAYVTVGLQKAGIADAVEAGFQAFKLFVGGDATTNRVATAVERIKEARSIVGPEAPLMIDAWMSWDLETTLAVAEKAAEFDIGWLEDPLQPDDLAGYETLRDKSPVPIAGGEHDFTTRVFADLIDRGVFQVLQPDVTWAGGLTTLIDIYELANKAGVRVCPHRGSEIWSLHAMAALDSNPLAESGRHWMTWVGGQPDVEKGSVTLPEGGAGFGVDIDEARLVDVWQ